MASFDDDVDDFDFGGDEMEQIQPQGTGNITSLVGEEEEEEEDVFPVKKPVLSGEDHATTTILNLRASLEEKEAVVKQFEGNLSRVTEELKEWADTFKSETVAGMKIEPKPSSVLEAIKTLQTSRDHFKEKAQVASLQENVILLKQLEKDSEIANLKNKIAGLQEALKPTNLEVRKLVLDPIIHREFEFLKAEMERSEKRCRQLADDLASVQFTPHSKHGKMLMAKCRTLQEENEEMGQNVAEGKVHELENKLALQKQLNAELKRGYAELQEYVDDMNEEAEKLQSTIYTLQRQVKQRDKSLQDLNHQLKKAKEIKEIPSSREDKMVESLTNKHLQPPKVERSSDSERKSKRRRDSHV